MAVYTDISDAELDAFLAGYEIGAPASFKGIAEGVENSNFLLETDRGRFFLTIYERRVRAADLPFFLGFMQHLARHGKFVDWRSHGFRFDRGHGARRWPLERRIPQNGRLAKTARPASQNAGQNCDDS